MKLNKEKQGKANTIIMDIEEFLNEISNPNNTIPLSRQDILEYYSDVICQLDTDIAIEVMEHFPEGKNIAKMIKIEYGY